LKSDESCILDPKSEISNRTSSAELDFGVRATRVAKKLPGSREGRHVSQQLLPAGVIHLLRIVLKELNETKSWLEQIVANGRVENRELVLDHRSFLQTARGCASPI
jgi:hypothetical protein